MTNVRTSHCRSCGSGNLQEVVDFGAQPLAGNFPLEPDSACASRRYPLDLTVCRSCGLLQVTHLPPIGEVFHADYRYSSSTVPGLRRHFDDYAQWLAQRIPPGARVLEFGCNDGVLLTRLRDRGMAVVGVDASDNVAQIARGAGLEVHTGFFTKAFVAEHAWQGSFDLVTCSNVFAHIDDVLGCAAAAHSSLRPGGLFAVEVHNATAIFDQNQFDTVYHEHLTYYTGNTLADLLRRSGFEAVELGHTDMHGDGLRLLVRRVDGERPPASGHGEEAERALAGSRSIREAIARCSAQVRELRNAHGLLYGFGAAGRSQMFLNMTQTADCFGIVFDDSPLRQARYIAGTDLPIGPYANQAGGCCVILAWNYGADIARRVTPRFEKVVTLLPEMRVW